MSNILSISKDLKINLSEVNEPAVFGGKMVRLKHEFIYADYDLTVPEQAVIFFFMSKFNTEDFLSSSDVINALYSKETGWDFSKINRRLTDRVYWSVEHRSIVLSAYEVADVVQRGYRKNYNSIESAVESIQKKVLKIRGENEDGTVTKRNISPIEYSAFFKDESGNNKVLLAFSQSFMPYILAFSGYQSLNLESIASLKSKYAVRYYHWMLHQLTNPNTPNTINITVESIRERFGLAEGALVRHFFKRVVEDPINEINEKTELNIKIGKVNDNQKRGKPLSKVIFKIAKK